MNSLLKNLLSVSEPIFSECFHGLEREALRIVPNGNLALSAHPAVLGSALCHPHITTDFSESQIEYTTQPRSSLDSLLEELEFLCHHVRRNIGAEQLWPFSMPCRLPESQQIPLASYGTSALGHRKHIYRKGLSHRYGAKMQTISGVHYNFSFGQNFWDAYFELKDQASSKKSIGKNIGGNIEKNIKNNINDHISEAYLSIIRNFLRRIYIFPYLFGDSPAIDKSFIEKKEETGPEKRMLKEAVNKLSRWESSSSGKSSSGGPSSDTLYAVYATSLRQSEMGYNHPVQWELQISCNSLEEYCRDMRHALTKTQLRSQKQSADPNPIEQLSNTLLQIENEHYALIRPKQNLREKKERPLTALERRGIEYLELRCFDIQSSACCGIAKEDLSFAQLFLYHCLLSPSPPLYPEEEKRNRENFLKVIWDGRNPNCKIRLGNTERALRDDGLILCEEIEPLALRLDKECGGSSYTESLAAQKEKFSHTDSIPSARFLESISSHQPSGYLEWGLSEAEKHSQDSLHYIPEKKSHERMDSLAASSLEKQKELELELEIEQE